MKSATDGELRAPAEERGLRPKILVMDDSETVLEVIQDRLEEGGFDVVTLSSSALLPSVWVQERPDLALIDVSMPVMDGHSVVELIRRSSLHRCPLVLHSDQPESRLQELTRLSGASGYIRKTPDGAALLRQISAFLQPGATRQAQVAPDQKLLVFVVDDDPVSGSAMESAVRVAGGEPVFLEGGARCLAELEKRQPSLILMNLRMNPMGGDACCRAIRENRSWASLPIVMVSSVSTVDVMHAWRSGADDFLPRTVEAGQLALKFGALRRASQPGQLTTPLQPRPVLLIEHGRFFRARLGSMLECSGYRLLYAKNEAGALAALSKHGKELGAVLVGLELPGGKALELISAAKDRCSGPVLALSEAEAASDVVREAERLTGAPVGDKKHPCELTVKRLSTALRLADNLRVCERVPFFSLVDFRQPAGVWTSGFSFDLSPSGIFVTTLNPEPPEAEVELRVTFPGRGQVQCSGRVAWANPFAQRSTYSYTVGMGVHVNGGNDEFFELLARFTRGSGSAA